MSYDTIISQSPQPKSNQSHLEKLYQDGAFMNKKKEEMARIKKATDTDEMDLCTFKPDMKTRKKG